MYSGDHYLHPDDISFSEMISHAEKSIRVTC